MADIIGKGTLLRRWNSTTGAWENLAGVLNITGPSMTRATIDTTALDTAGGYRTFIPGFRDPGQLRASIKFGRTSFDLLKSDFESDDLQNYEIVLPDADQTSLEFEGFPTELPLTIPADALVMTDTVIQISGQVSVESGSGPSAGA